MVRPPPLQLRADNWCPDLGPRLSAAAPRKPSWVGRVYGRSWRAPVIVVATLNVLRYLNCAHNAFNDFEVDKYFDASELALLSFVMGVVYVTLSTVELFGCIANALPRRLHLIETYTGLTYVSSVLVTICGLIQTSSYLVYKQELLTECERSVGQVRSIRSTFLKWSIGATPESVSKECLSSYNASITPVILSFPISYLLPMLFQLILVYTYYQQSTDPLHTSNLCYQYQHQNSRSVGPVPSYHKLPPASSPSSSSNNPRDAYAKGTRTGWLSFTTRTPFFSRFHSFITRSSHNRDNHPRYQAVPTQAYSRHRQQQHHHHRRNGLNDGAQANGNDRGIKVPHSLAMGPRKDTPALPGGLSPDALMTPGPPSYGDGPGGAGRHHETLYGMYGGGLSVFAIGSAGSADAYGYTYEG